ncbi:hypothetical protein M0813_00586 [Anaeramoeba flamelloides]|uniref:Methyltransferase type 11 domain-containing protein n=1 Tax=Anaeramoeba flamelloides TaxID=1746091 RepID=A0ABQ8XMW7_9EUKA|nr:hypothetical protein M0813_00586 [Anaeramoeba flamelloides]
MSSVAILSGCVDPRFDLDVEKTILKCESISAVEVFPAHKATPTFEDLNKHDMCVVYSFHFFKDPVALGDLLAKYVTCGKGLLIFSMGALIQGSSVKAALSGQIVDGGFVPLAKGPNLTTKSTLGKTILKGHPILENVETFTGGESVSWRVRAIVSNLESSRLVAEWKDTVPLITEARKGSKFGIVVVLNFNAFSKDVSSISWSREDNHAELLISNSCSYILKGVLFRKKKNKGKFSQSNKK